jgi:tetratricopeptide (TPR) repeat protein
MPKPRRVAVLLRDLQSKHLAALRRKVGPSLILIAEQLIERLASESLQQHRRFTALRRSDILGHSHAEIARDEGLSRSQFYRDLHAARERLAAALEAEFSVRAATPEFLEPEVAARRVSIEALRNSGRHDRARNLATASLHVASPAEAVEVLCLRAELETESGDFGAAQKSTANARALLPQVDESGRRTLLAIACDLADFEWAHCRGTPVDPARRDGCLAEVRRRYAAGERGYAQLLVKALVGEASLLFARGEEFRALALIEEAAALVRGEPSVDSRLAVDVQVRVSGLHALRADALSTALEEAASIVDAGMRWHDARTLRLGLQSMSAHLLTLGRLDEAREYARQALWLIELFGSPLDRTIVLSNLARIEVHRRDGAQALHWIALARDLHCDAFPITQAIAISEVEAFVLMGEPARAIQAARAVGRRVRD